VVPIQPFRPDRYLALHSFLVPSFPNILRNAMLNNRSIRCNAPKSNPALAFHAPNTSDSLPSTQVAAQHCRAVLAYFPTIISPRYPISLSSCSSADMLVASVPAWASKEAMPPNVVRLAVCVRGESGVSLRSVCSEA